MKYDLAVIIDRFQPVHSGHIYLINEAKKLAKEVLVLINSSNAPLSRNKLFTHTEIYTMLDEYGVKIEYIYDWKYQPNQWLTEVQGAIKDTGEYDNICLISDRDKDYLHWFPNWQPIILDGYKNLSSKKIRDLILSDNIEQVIGYVPDAVYNKIKILSQLERFDDLCDEYNYYEDSLLFRAQVIVVQSGYILLYEKSNNMYEIPTTSLIYENTFKDAILKLLRDNIKLKVPEPVLNGSIIKEEIFDNPYDYSNNRRIISKVFMIQLDNKQELPKIKGDNKCSWISLTDFYTMPRNLYEDNYSIITKMIDNT